MWTTEFMNEQQIAVAEPNSADYDQTESYLADYRETHPELEPAVEYFRQFPATFEQSEPAL